MSSPSGSAAGSSRPFRHSLRGTSHQALTRIPYDRLVTLSMEIPADMPWQEAGIDIGDAAALAVPTEVAAER